MIKKNKKELRCVRSGKITNFGSDWHNGRLHAYNGKTVEIKGAVKGNECGFDVFTIRGNFIYFIKTHNNL